MTWIPRHEAEKSKDLIQPIPCALVLDVNQEYYVFRRIKDGRADLRGRISLLVGGHIDWAVEDREVSSLIMATLMREIKEELGMEPASSAKPIGVVIDFSSVQSSRHIGIVHEVVVAGAMRPKAPEEFSTRSQHIGQVYTPRTLSPLRKKLDPWSMIIFGDYINPYYSLEIGQQLRLLPPDDPLGVSPRRPPV